MLESPRSFLVIFILFIALTASGVQAADRCTEPVARLASLEGNVTLQTAGNGSWQPAAPDQGLCAGDALRTGAHSRAALVLTDKSLVRLDQHSTLRLVSAPEDRSTLAELLEGFLYFFSRTPQQLELRSPYLNASVDGTEFAMQVTGGAARVLVFEGEVLAANGAGRVKLTAGQGAEAAGGAPLRLPARRDAVEWAAHFPPLAVPGDPAVTGSAAAGALAAALETARDGDLPGALAELDQVPEARRDAGYHATRAGLLLQAGDVAAARDALDRAEANGPEPALAPALRSVIALVTGDEAETLAQARQATQRNPDSPAAWIALSYAEQARFHLDAAVEAALEAARQAVGAAPASALAQGRRAELLLAQGRSGEALEAARRAVELDPRLAPAHAVLGFAHLNRIELSEARGAFQAAVERDPSAPLPRLGLGLADIRAGRLAEGRRALETAVALDPGRSLLRSYLGKAYYEELREGAAATEYAIARELDPADPTPWFYDAIREQTANQPVAALKDLQAAQDRNDNRAVYRSRLLLDDDAAARQASQGRIYRDLGFEELGLRQGWRSVASNPANQSGHRLLSDIYAARPRQDIARVSELLQAQLLQPLSLSPVPPQLAESELLLVERGGPTALGFNEFNPLFVRNGLAVQADGLYGSNDTWANDLVLSGIGGPVSFSAGQFHYETDGFRDNNDLEQNLYNAFLQAELTPWLNVQAEFRHRDSEHGDLELRFDPDDFDPLQRRRIDQNTARLGLRLTPVVGSQVLVSAIHSDREEDLVQSSGPLPGSLTVADNERDGYQVEGQYLHWGGPLQLLAGGGLHRDDSETDIELRLPVPVCPLPSCEFEDDARLEHTNGYVYGHVELPASLLWTAGVSFDDFEDGEDEVRRFNPKLGLQWRLLPGLNLRAAWFRTVKRPILASQSLEPTQVAGFSQFFDDANGTKTEVYGFGVDARLSPQLNAGAEYFHRELDWPIFSLSSNRVERFRRDEHLVRSYLYWAPAEHWALRVEPQFERFLRGADDPGVIQAGDFRKVETILLPISLRRFGPHGLFAEITATGVSQEIAPEPGVELERDEDDFVLMDLTAGYRLPNRQGIVSIAVENIFDREFFYQDINMQSPGALSQPRFIPDRRIVAKATFAFR